MTAAYASIPPPSIREEKVGDPIEITFSIQKYNIPHTGLAFLDEDKAKFPIFDTVDTNNGVSNYLHNLLNSNDVGFILKYNNPFSKTYARATVVKRGVTMDVVPSARKSKIFMSLDELELTHKADSPFRPRRKDSPKSGKKVSKKSGKVRKNKKSKKSRN